MKKIILLTVLVSFVIAGSAMATTLTATTDQDGATLSAVSPASGVIGKCSTGVRIGVTYDDANGSGYSMITTHKSGSKYYGSAFDSTSIFVQSPAGDINAAFGDAVPDTSVSATAFPSPWSSL